MYHTAMRIMSRPVFSSALFALAVGIPLIAVSSLVAFDSPLTDAPPSDTGPDYDVSPAVLAVARIVIWLGIRFVFLVLLAVAIYFARRFFSRVRSGDPVYRRWLIVSSGFIGVNTIVLLLIWPGFWVFDEFYVLADVQENWLGTWQHIFTSIYFGVALTAIPIPSGILIVQYVFASFVAGYVVARSWSLFSRPKLAYLLILPFLFFPVLLFNQFPLRVTMVTYIELAVLFRALVIWLRRDLVTNRYREFFFLTTALTIAAFWRSETAPLLLLIPVLAILLRVFRPTEAGVPLRRAVAVLIATALAFTGIAGLSVASSSPRYPITAALNPLSIMLQEPLGGPNLTRNLEAIDRVVDVQKVREVPDIFNIHLDRALRPDYRAHLTEFELAYASLVIENPTAFLNARIRTFLATNSIGDIPGNEIQGGGFLAKSAERYLGAFQARNPSAVPLSEEVRFATVRTLLLVPSGTSPTPLTPIVWTVIPVLLALFVSLIVALFRRCWMFATTFAILLAQAGITFVTAPASYFMYYWAVYLAGWVLVGFFALRPIRARDGRPSLTKPTSRMLDV